MTWERVDAQDRVRARPGVRFRDPRAHVRGHQFQLIAAFFAEPLEEPRERLDVRAGGRPHQPSGVIVDHDREVPLPLAIADLVNPDLTQTGEQIDPAASLVRNPLDDPTDRPPRDPLQLRDRSLRRLHR